VYRVAPETTATEFPPRRLESLVGRLLDELPERGRRRALRRVGEDFGRELADAARLKPATTVRGGLERMCAAVRSLGFQASLRELDGDTAVIATPTCPLRPLVVERPEAAEIDRGMWAGLAERCLHGVHAAHVTCETANCLDDHASCEVVLRLQLARASGATARR
jgi:predicted ArsR family transcriptional regulator